MGMKIIINHYTDGFSGHVNFTLKGEVNGVVYDAITVGANVGHNQSMFLDLLTGGGEIRREDPYVDPTNDKYRDPSRRGIELLPLPHLRGLQKNLQSQLHNCRCCRLFW